SWRPIPVADGKKLKSRPAKQAAGAPPASAASDPGSRYQRVQQILDRAAGQSAATYGGLGARFWNTLSISELVEAHIEEIRRIAPEKEVVHSCCTPRPQTAPAASRADRSGLIAGLRGLPPFDGLRFPRLMWGGSAVGDEDIQFIADWINDGLPESD